MIVESIVKYKRNVPCMDKYIKLTRINALLNLLGKPAILFCQNYVANNVICILRENMSIVE